MTSATIANEVPPEDDVTDVTDAKPARKLDPGFAKNLKIIGLGFAILVVLIVGMFMLRSSGGNKDSGQVSHNMRETTINNDRANNPISPAMRDNLVRKELDEQDRAKEKGDLVFTPRDTLAAPVPVGSNQTGIATPQPPAPAAAPPAPPPVDQAKVERDQRRRQGLETQLAQLLKTSDDTGGSSTQRVTFEQPKSQGQGAGAGGGAGAGSSGSIAGAASAAGGGKHMAEWLQIVPAETASPVDTYRTKFVSARITAGPLMDSYLVGEAKLVDEGLLTHFTAMRVPGKGTCKIDAIALDEKTSTDAMNADIDHRYLQRYVFPVAMAAAAGAAQAFSQTGSTVVSTAAGVVGASPAPTAEQARAAGIAAGVSIAQQEVNKAAQRPLQAQLENRTSIGILFNAAVDESSCK